MGFTETCARIWAFNAANTRKMHAFGGCLGTCLLHIFTPNNVPSGTHNPCEPLASSSSTATLNPLENAPPAPGVGASAATSAGVCETGAAGEGGKGAVTADGRKKSKGYCGEPNRPHPAAALALSQAAATQQPRSSHASLPYNRFSCRARTSCSPPHGLLASHAEPATAAPRTTKHKQGGAPTPCACLLSS